MCTQRSAAQPLGRSFLWPCRHHSPYHLLQGLSNEKKTVRLFHFTSDWHILSIRTFGLVPRAPALFLHGDGCTYFTTHERPDAGHGLNDFKTEWRLEVDTDRLPGVRVVHWLTYAREQGLDEAIIDAAVRTGGGPEAAESWWIALDPIAPEQILSQHNRQQQQQKRSNPMKASVVREDTGEVLRECKDIPEAEAVIAEIEKTDPQGVHAGNYGIDPDEEAYIAYQSGPRVPRKSSGPGL